MIHKLNSDAHKIGTPNTILASGVSALTELPFADAATPFAVPLRDASGDLIVPLVPGSPSAAASKDYVDSIAAVGSVVQESLYQSDGTIGLTATTTRAVGSAGTVVTQYTQTITPVFASSRIEVLVGAILNLTANSGNRRFIGYNIVRDNTNLVGLVHNGTPVHPNYKRVGRFTSASLAGLDHMVAADSVWFDYPNTTLPTTYTFCFAIHNDNPGSETLSIRDTVGEGRFVLLVREIKQ